MEIHWRYTEVPYWLLMSVLVHSNVPVYKIRYEYVPVSIYIFYCTVILITTKFQNFYPELFEGSQKKIARFIIDMEKKKTQKVIAKKVLGKSF